MTDPALGDVQLAVSEAITNVVHHAYADAEPGEFRVTIDVADEQIAVTVEDDGAGMRPRPDSPGLGLGLPLIATLAERFETHSSEDGGTRLCMWFSRRAAAPALRE